MFRPGWPSVAADRPEALIRVDRPATPSRPAPVKKTAAAGLLSVGEPRLPDDAAEAVGRVTPPASGVSCLIGRVPQPIGSPAQPMPAGSPYPVCGFPARDLLRFARTPEAIEKPETHVSHSLLRRA